MTHYRDKNPGVWEATYAAAFAVHFQDLRKDPDLDATSFLEGVRESACIAANEAVRAYEATFQLLMPRIKCVAIRTSDGVVHSLPAPHRHHHVIHHLVKVVGYPPPIANAEQGFLTTEDTFVTRVEAKCIARKAGQLIARHSHHAELFSEDVW